MKGKKIASLLLTATMLAAAFSGCGSVNPTETAATLNGKAIEAGLVNFVAQNTAASYDTYMASYYGRDMWEQEMGSTEGETLADEVRHEALDTIELQYLLEEHMGDYGVTITDEELSEIDKATAEFLSENTEKALKIMGADEKYVKEMLRLKLVEKKMRDAIYETVDTEVTDEELAERNAPAEEEETEEAAEETSEEAAEDASEEASEDTTEEAAEETEAPEVTAEDIIAERQSDLYTEVTEGYKSAAEFTVNENVLKKINFSKFLNIVSDPEEEGTETVSETESAGTETASETEEAGTESVSETETAGTESAN